MLLLWIVTLLTSLGSLLRFQPRSIDNTVRRLRRSPEGLWFSNNYLLFYITVLVLFQQITKLYRPTPFCFLPNLSLTYQFSLLLGPSCDVDYSIYLFGIVSFMVEFFFCFQAQKYLHEKLALGLGPLNKVATVRARLLLMIFRCSVLI